MHLGWAPHWFTAVVIYGYSFVYNLGVAIVPFVITAEVFLPEVNIYDYNFTMSRRKLLLTYVLTGIL